MTQNHNLGKHLRHHRMTARVAAMGAAIMFAAPPLLTAEVTVDPNEVGAAEITNEAGNPADPTTTTNTDNLVVGFNDLGELLIDTDNKFNGLTSVINAAGTIGFNAGAEGAVTVTGNGATWTNAGNLTVGLEGGGLLTIEDGAAVTNTTGFLGSGGDAFGTATVTGTGSTWTHSDQLFVGGSTLSASAGGSLAVSSGGSVNVANTLKLWNTGTIDLSSGGAITTGSLDNTANGTLNHSGGTLTINGGALLPDGTGNYAVGGTDPHLVLDNATFTLPDAGTIFVGNLNVGNTGMGSLTIQNGSTATVRSAHAGSLLGSSGSGTITVTGVGSTLTSNVNMVVGLDGPGTLNVEAGGSVVSGVLGSIGDSIGATGTATVTGSGSTWTNNGALHVGNFGTGTLNITNGGSVTVETLGVIGFGRLTEFDFGIGDVLVNGTGSTLTSNNELRVGGGGEGNLSVEAGGRVVSSGLVSIGHDPGSRPSDATVDGSASTWTHNGEFHVGGGGSGTLLVQNGGSVTDTIGLIGVSPGAIGTATVTGTNSTWSHSDQLFVGGTAMSAGGGGILTVDSGGSVSVTNTLKQWNSSTINLNAGGSIAAGSLDNTANGNLNHTGGTLTISGPFLPGGTGDYEIDGPDNPHLVADGLLFALPTGRNLLVGPTATGSLTLQNGATFTDGTGLTSLGRDSFSSSTLAVTGNGSRWTTAGLTVGDTGTGFLQIDNGGTVDVQNVSAPLRIGRARGSVGTVAVSGNGSTLTSIHSIIVGDGLAPTVGPGSGGTLRIEDGGTVSSNRGIIGLDTTSTGAVVVTDPGSTLHLFFTLEVAGNSSNSSLRIENGGAVNDRDGIIGSTSSSGGVATITGAGSNWTHINSITVGSSGAGHLRVEDGGVVVNPVGMIAELPGSSGTATVTGPGSTWTNNEQLAIGGSLTAAGGNGTLNIEAGGTVVADSFNIWPTGALNLVGGTLTTVGDISAGSLPVNFIAGTVQISQSKTLAFQTMRGLDVATLSIGKTLRVDGTVTISSPLTLTGGTLSADRVQGFQLVDFQSGTWKLTQDDLTVGLTGQTGATINLGASKHIDVTHNVAIDAIGLVNLNGGSLTAATTTNNGQIHLAGVSSLLNGITIQNNALLTGDGRVGAALHNNATGQVRNTTGQTLSFLGSGNTNSGVIATIGGTIDFLNDLTNTARIDGQNGVFQFNDGLINDGQFSMSVGNSSVFGTVTNSVSGKVNIAGASTATFFGDVTNEGDYFIGDGSRAVFAGNVNGSGDFLGSGGIVEFTAGFSPGSSPGEVLIDGDAAFSSSNTLVLELAGTTAGSEYDHVIVGGELTAAGILDIQLLDGFAPQSGDTFDLLDFGSLSGSFSEVLLPKLGRGLSFDTSSLLTNGSISVIPEPSSLLLFSLTVLGMIVRRGSICPEVRRCPA